MNRERFKRKREVVSGNTNKMKKRGLKRVSEVVNENIRKYGGGGKKRLSIKMRQEMTSNIIKRFRK